MVRVVQKIESGHAQWFIPSIDNNRSDPQPFKVLLEPLSGSDYQRLQAVMFSAQGGIMERSQGLIDTLFAQYVKRVEGYTIRGEDGAVVAPHDGATLIAAIKMAQAADLAIIDEVVDALKDRSKLEAGLEKKSDTLSASSSPTASPRANGRVPSASATPLVQIPSLTQPSS